jgi:hypothetical protein
MRRVPIQRRASRMASSMPERSWLSCASHATEPPGRHASWLAPPPGCSLPPPSTPQLP